VSLGARVEHVASPHQPTCPPRTHTQYQRGCRPRTRQRTPAQNGCDPRLYGRLGPTSARVRPPLCTFPLLGDAAPERVGLTPAPATLRAPPCVLRPGIHARPKPSYPARDPQPTTTKRNATAPPQTPSTSTPTTSAQPLKRIYGL